MVVRRGDGDGVDLLAHLREHLPEVRERLDVRGELAEPGLCFCAASGRRCRTGRRSGRGRRRPWSRWTPFPSTPMLAKLIRCIGLSAVACRACAGLGPTACQTAAALAAPAAAVVLSARNRRRGGRRRAGVGGGLRMRRGGGARRHLRVSRGGGGERGGRSILPGRSGRAQRSRGPCRFRGPPPAAGPGGGVRLSPPARPESSPRDRRSRRPAGRDPPRAVPPRRRTGSPRPSLQVPPPAPGASGRVLLRGVTWAEYAALRGGPGARPPQNDVRRPDRPAGDRDGPRACCTPP